MKNYNFDNNAYFYYLLSQLKDQYYIFDRSFSNTDL